jgi:hypothetical protein
LLAKVVNDNAYLLVELGALETFASKLAPTIALSGSIFLVEKRSAVGTFAALAGAFLSVFVVLGATFAAIVLTVAHNWMFAQFA